MKSGKLNKRIEVWGETVLENDLLEEEKVKNKIKSIWSQMVPMTGSLKNQPADTVISGTTHKIITRYISGKFINDAMWFVYRGIRYDIKYILNPFEVNEKLEFFCEVVND